jgi:plastocyanin
MAVTRSDARRSIRRALALVALLPTGSLLACGGTATVEPTRAYTVDLDVVDNEDRYRFRITDGTVPDFTVGDEVTFAVTNTGLLNHDMRVVGPDDETRATAPAVAPGGGFDLTVLLDEPGIYRLECLVDDHLTTHRMRVLIEVADA